MASFKEIDSIVRKRSDLRRMIKMFPEKQLVLCEHCEGYGYMDNPGITRCPDCLGRGVVTKDGRHISISVIEKLQSTPQYKMYKLLKGD